MGSERLVRQRVKLSGAGIPLNGGIEPLRIEGLEPRTKPRQLARGKLLDGFLDIFGGGHPDHIAVMQFAEKVSSHSYEPGLRPMRMHWRSMLRYFALSFLL